ncbi:MAG: hypothetical protein C0601_11795 [Candidatus Muiribacterium halophilum]|uniref:DUF4911 domain-containing protein n=1 Tax=Muiribacterium halophilum TaxID=2053465 RepID=A0A2N5ZB87_MUIH1|nr:MAG: hypothetical protein C0601_11795 [Candidatus Muirbacterium halophilum]
MDIDTVSFYYKTKKEKMSEIVLRIEEFEGLAGAVIVDSKEHIIEFQVPPNSCEQFLDIIDFFVAKGYCEAVKTFRKA